METEYPTEASEIGRTETGCFVQRPCCEECDYFAQPAFANGRPTPPMDVCPKCGGTLEWVVGRYVTETRKSFFGLVKVDRYIKFLRRKKELLKACSIIRGHSIKDYPDSAKTVDSDSKPRQGADKSGVG